MTDIANRDETLNPEAEFGRAPRDAGDLSPQTTRERVGAGIEDNPLALVVGGLALGALAGALLPRTERETELMGSTGRALNDRAQSAFRAAKDAGLGKLDEAGVTGESARDQFNTLFKSIGQALQEAGGAATRSVRSGGATEFNQRP